MTRWIIYWLFHLLAGFVAFFGIRYFAPYGIYGGALMGLLIGMLIISARLIASKP